MSSFINSYSGFKYIAIANIDKTSLTWDGSTSPTLVGQQTSQTITLSNTGNARMTGTTPVVSGNAAFTISTTCGSSLAAGSSCVTTVTFAPSNTTTVTGTVTFTTNVGTKTTSLSGTGLTKQGSLAAASGSSTDFGSVLINTSQTRNFVFTNTGNTTLTGVYASVSDPTLTLTNNLAGTQASPISVSPGAQATYSVRYTPTTAPSTLSATTSVTSSATNSPSTLTLTGSGANPTWALYFEDGNGSTAFTDSGNQGGSWSGVGSISESTARAYAGSGSLSLNGSNQALVGPAINLTGNFSISAAFYTTSTVPSGTVTCIVGQWKQVTGQGGWSITIRPNNVVAFSFGAYSEAAPAITSGSNTFSVNAWNTVTVTRSGSTITLVVNGSTVGSVSTSAGRTLSVNTTIGQFYNSAGSLSAIRWFPGNIDNVVISTS